MLVTRRCFLPTERRISTNVSRVSSCGTVTMTGCASVAMPPLDERWDEPSLRAPRVRPPLRWTRTSGVSRRRAVSPQIREPLTA